MLKVENLKKAYKDKEVLRGLSFELSSGEITSLIGNNGSGKTTTFRLLLGLVEADEGTISFEGRPVEGRDVAYLSEQRSLYLDCSVYEQLQLTARLNRLNDFRARIDTCLDELRLVPYRHQLISRLSKGNQQKVALANCLMKDAQIIIMDEPFTALDRDNILLFIKAMERLRQQGKTVLISSHIYQPVNDICDHFLVLKDGMIIKDVHRRGLYEEQRRNVITDADTEMDFDLTDIEQHEEGQHVRYSFDSKEQAREFLKELIRSDCDFSYTHSQIGDYL